MCLIIGAIIGLRFSIFIISGCVFFKIKDMFVCTTGMLRERTIVLKKSLWDFDFFKLKGKLVTEVLEEERQKNVSVY